MNCNRVETIDTIEFNKSMLLLKRISFEMTKLNNACDILNKIIENNNDYKCKVNTNQDKEELKDKFWNDFSSSFLSWLLISQVIFYPVICIIIMRLI
ncbi:MAG: hypothetical protein IKO41_15875 [Lachnospiraceae bacterium]|nr:hypothetical protein [Lachnospiraceae bacterium]